jgi:outer membrane protein
MKQVLLFIFLFSYIVLFAQKELSVQDCIEMGLKNEKSFIQQRSSLERSDVDQYFGKLSFLPVVSANAGYFLNYGRKLDPFTNTFGVNSVFSNQFGLSTQMVLFQGFRYFKQNEILRLTNSNFELEYKRTEEKVKNQVIDKCISIWKLQLKIEQQKETIANLKDFQNRQIELEKEGRLSAIDLLETTINSKNKTIELARLQRDISYEIINLNFLIGLPLMENTVLKKFESLSPEYQITFDEYYHLEDLKNKLEIVELEYELDKTQFIPSISLYGNLGTGYSTNNKDYTQSNSPIIPYSMQISQNSYQGFGVNLSVPLFNKGEWFKKQQLYQIAKNEQSALIELKVAEIEKKKVDFLLQERTTQEALKIHNEVSNEMKSIIELNQLLYLEGKIRLSELEKIEEDYQAYIQMILDLEIEVVKMGLTNKD